MRRRNPRLGRRARGAPKREKRVAEMAEENVLPREYVERALTNRKCHKTASYSTAEKWVTSKNHSVTVPKECDRETFDAILVDIQAHGGHD
jgi:hypothetical protein